MTYEFTDAAGKIVGSAKLGPVTPAQRGNGTKLLKVTKTTSVPAATRTVKITIAAIRGSGAYNDGYSDNVAIQLLK